MTSSRSRKGKAGSSQAGASSAEEAADVASVDPTAAAAPPASAIVPGPSNSGSGLNILIAIVPLLPSVALFMQLRDADIDVPASDKSLPLYHQLSTRMQLIASAAIAVGGFLATSSLVPVIAEYTRRKGLCGKDLCKRGLFADEKDIPEALGIVSGCVYLICAVTSLLLFAHTQEKLTIFNSALFSICFMIFLGYADDTLDLKWRYKLILPTVASLPLLVSYSGSTTLYVPAVLRFLLWDAQANGLTPLGRAVDLITTVDTEGFGAIVELKYLFLIFMGLLAVFCTNAINILAGINGLECGQSYVIGASILAFKLYDLLQGNHAEHQMFALVMIIPFLGVALGLLRHNWYPSSVFVGDTFCYFAGMTFAVVGIHGHFSKTLLLLFVPQIINFVFSIPQLFKILPCPRHRLPKINTKTGLLQCSTFPCEAHEYKWLKQSPNDTECPNCTLICLVLRITGPLNERNLCVTILAFQMFCSCCAFYVRYFLFEDNQ